MRFLENYLTVKILPLQDTSENDFCIILENQHKIRDLKKSTVKVGGAKELILNLLIKDKIILADNYDIYLI